MKPIAAASSSSLIALTLVACTPMSRERTEAREAPEILQATGPAAAGSVPMQSSMLDQIRADAAQRAGVAMDAVQVLKVEAVTWSDGSLGCPEPGMMYTQALVPGYRIRVDAAGTQLLYHAGAQHTFVHCPPERAREPSPMDPT